MLNYYYGQEIRDVNEQLANTFCYETMFSIIESSIRKNKKGKR